MFRLVAALLVALITGCSQPVDQTKIVLTEAELKYVAAQPSVIWAVEENRPPYIFVEGGNIRGLAPEYIELIAKKTGLKFRPENLINFESAANALKDKKVDVMTTVRPTPETAEYMGFTPPFAYQGGVFVFRTNTLPRSPMTTGISKESAAKKYLVTRFPDMNLIEAEDDEESISLLNKGLVDGSVTDAGTARYLTDKGGVPVRTAIINFDFPYSFAYRKDDTILGSILTKAVSSISSKEKEQMNAKWLKEKEK